MLNTILTTEFGKGFSERSIWQFRQFYQMFPDFENMRTPLAQSQNVDNSQNTIMRTPFAHSELSSHLQKLNWAQIQRIIIELKTHKITHQDIGQLDMYIRMYDKLRRKESDNPTIGILLCTETDQTIAQYSVLNENEQLCKLQKTTQKPLSVLLKK